jgi:hypothetical protein
MAYAYTISATHTDTAAETYAFPEAYPDPDTKAYTTSQADPG